jgi:hypothetical protein
VPAARSAACDLILNDGRRAVVVASLERHRRDTIRTAELVARTETKLMALELRVRAGRGVARTRAAAHDRRARGTDAVARARRRLISAS